MKKIISLFTLALLTTSAWAANTYVKVTSLDQLEAGKKYILVNEENSRAMGPIAGTSTTYGSAISVTIISGVIDIEDTDVVELTAADGGTHSYGPTWSFTYEDGAFMFWNSGNSLSTISTAGVSGLTGAKWVPASTDDGVILKSNGDISRILQYNASSPRFACYTTSQQPAVLYVEYVPAEEEGITKLSEANALEDGESFTFNGDAVVTICWKGSVYVRDESGYGQIANYDGTFENGQVLSQGWKATKTSVDGWVKFIDAADLSASGETNAELAAAQKLTSVDESMLNAYVYVEKVYKSFLPIRSITLADGTIIPLTGTGNQPATGNYNIYGIIWKSGDALVFEPVAWEKYVAPFLRGDVNKDTEVNIADVTALIDKLLNNAEMIPEADCNQDTEMNIADVTALIDYLLNGAWPN